MWINTVTTLQILIIAIPDPMNTQYHNNSQFPDRRSYHVFAAAGGSYLFDRSTGITAAISDDLAESLASGWECLGSDPHFDVEFNKLLGGLRAQGFFQYVPVDQAEQEELLEGLWRHKPRRIQLLMAQGCNLGCRYCYAWRNGSNQKGTLMPFEVAKQSVDFLVERSGGRRDL